VDIACHLFEREFVAYRLEQCRVQAAGKREEAIRHPSLPAEEGGHGRQHRIESSVRLSRYDWRSIRPDQTTARLIVHMRRGIEEGVREGLQVLLIQVELEFESLIGGGPWRI
jgi:hypothetical protein